MMILSLALLAATINAEATSAQDGGAAASLTEGVAAFAHGDCDSALEWIAPVLAGVAPAGVPETLLLEAYAAASACASRVGDRDAAYRYAVAGTARPRAPDSLWSRRLGLEIDQNRLAEGVSTVETLARQRPGALNAYPGYWIVNLSERIDRSGAPPLQMRLLEVMTRDGYRPVELFPTPDIFRKLYAEHLFEAGEKERAFAQVRAVHDAATALQLSLDPRFHAFLPADFDPRAQVERQLVDALALAKTRPDQLEPLVLAALLMRQLGRPQQAIALLRSVKSPEQYADAEKQLSWWWDSLAHSYEAIGAYDEAVAAFSAGTAAGERGGLNVSQRINLAFTHLLFGKPEAALAELAAFGDASRALSPFGAMQFHLARGCARAAVRDAAGAAEDRRYAEAHDAEEPRVLPGLLLCLGDMDAAAAAIIRALENPARRTATLLELCDYDAPSPGAPVDPLQIKIDALKLRPDVQAAIARAGGTRRIHLQPGEI